MENLYAKIGQRIVQIRHANNLTQYQLAEMLDISVKHCSAQSNEANPVSH